MCRKSLCAKDVRAWFRGRRYFFHGILWPRNNSRIRVQVPKRPGLAFFRRAAVRPPDRVPRQHPVGVKSKHGKGFDFSRRFHRFFVASGVPVRVCVLSAPLADGLVCSRHWHSALPRRGRLGAVGWDKRSAGPPQTPFVGRPAPGMVGRRCACPTRRHSRISWFPSSSLGTHVREAPLRTWPSVARDLTGAPGPRVLSAISGALPPGQEATLFCPRFAPQVVIPPSATNTTKKGPPLGAILPRGGPILIPDRTPQALPVPGTASSPPSLANRSDHFNPKI